VNRVRAAESALVGAGKPLPLTEAAARNLAKLMAYKDEYEVARLYTDPIFLTSCARSSKASRAVTIS
jgi:indolepyruvate ferredoxin oxidoreductase